MYGWYINLPDSEDEEGGGGNTGSTDGSDSDGSDSSSDSGGDVGGEDSDRAGAFSLDSSMKLSSKRKIQT